MKKRLPVFIAIVCFTLGSLMIDSFSRANESVPETLVLKTINAKKPARFPHRKHQENFACKECHHSENPSTGAMSEYVSGMVIMKCASCHNSIEMKNLKLNSFKLAAHGLCKECHKRNRASAPTKCSGCHIK